MNSRKVKVEIAEDPKLGITHLMDSVHELIMGSNTQSFAFVFTYCLGVKDDGTMNRVTIRSAGPRDIMASLALHAYLSIQNSGDKFENAKPCQTFVEDEAQ